MYILEGKQMSFTCHFHINWTSLFLG